MVGFNPVQGPGVAMLKAEVEGLGVGNGHSLGEWQVLSEASSFTRCSICGCAGMVDIRGGLGIGNRPERTISGGVISGRCSGKAGEVGKALGWAEDESTDEGAEGAVF
jgi:hypothetical protein